MNEKPPQIIPRFLCKIINHGELRGQRSSTWGRDACYPHSHLEKVSAYSTNHSAHAVGGRLSAFGRVDQKLTYTVEIAYIEPALSSLGLNCLSTVNLSD